MNGLLDVAKVDVGDGDWTASYLSESLGCAVSAWLADPCDPTPDLISGTDGVDPSAYLIRSFAAIVKMSRTNRCAEGRELEWVRSSMEEATEFAVAKVFWEGLPSLEVSLAADDVQSAAAGANVAASVAAALLKFGQESPGVEPILHLGIGAALSIGDLLNDEGNLKIGVRVATSPGYPTAGIAVTGPILIHLGQIEAVQVYDRDVNRTNIEANRLGAIDFDPCVAVLVAP